MPTDKETIARLVEEMENRAPLTLVLRAPSVLHVCGLVQFALRHPTLSESSRYAARTFIEHARAYFADAPTVLDVIRRGDDPQEDR